MTINFKINKNTKKRIEFSGSSAYGDDSFITASVYDNYNVSRAIPRSDYQYGWITASIAEDDRFKFDYDYATSSTDYNFTTSSVEIRSYFNGAYSSYYDAYIPNFVVQFVSSSDSSAPDPTEGYFRQQYFELTDDLLLKPNDAANLSSLYYRRMFARLFARGCGNRYLDEIRNWQHREYLNKNNIYAIANEPRLYLSSSYYKARRGTGNKKFTETPVSINIPLDHKYNHYIDPKKGIVGPQRVKYTYGNNIDFFGNEELNSRIIDDIDRSNEIYDYILSGYSNTDEKFNPIRNFIYLDYSEQIFPKSKYTFLGQTRKRENFKSEYWRESKNDRYVDSIDYAGQVITKPSIWYFDSKEASDDVTPPFNTGSTVPTDANAGLFQLPGIYFYNTTSDIDRAKLTASVNYARRFAESSSVGLSYAGYTNWEVDNSASSTPFYDDYDEYSDDLKFLMKEGSIIPEYRISDLVSAFEESGDFNERDDFFSLTGSSVQDSSSVEFFDKYLSSQNLTELSKIKSDHEGIGEIDEINIEIKASKKLLPYEGFYPASRVKQLFEVFTGSYNIFKREQFGFSSSPLYQASPIVQSLFAPGVLMNSIKSGLACDFPYFTTGSYDDPHDADVGDLIEESAGTWSDKDPFADFIGSARTSASATHRLPFDDGIIYPEKYYGVEEREIVLAESHPSSSVQYFYQGNQAVSGDPSYYRSEILKKNNNYYNYAMSNFISECSNVFIKDGFSHIESANEEDSSFGVVDLNKRYMARLIVRTENYTDWDEYDKTGGIYNTNFAPYDRPYFDNSELYEWSSLGGAQSYRQRYFHAGSAFGPTNGSHEWTGSYAGVNYFPHTPPYMPYGIAEYILALDPADIVGSTSGSVKVDASAIKNNLLKENNLTSKYTNYQARAGVPSSVDSDTMQIEETFDIFKLKKYDSGSSLVINPKFEFPVFNYNKYKSSNVELPTVGSGSVSTGNWLQWGEDQTEQESLRFDLLEYGEDRITEDGGDTSLTGSLIDVLGFDQEQSRRIGELNDELELKESIVLVPYIDKKEKQFITYNRDKLDSLGDYRDKIEKFFSEYNIPPTMDFINNNINPFVVLFAEFSVKMGRNDIKKWWHNVRPDVVNKIKIENKSVNASIFNEEVSELLSNGNLQWLVFKVKQKANWDFDAYKDNKLYNAGKEEKFDYCYNWPYDYMSIVEMCNIKLKIRLSNNQDKTIELEKIDKIKSLTDNEIFLNRNISNDI